MRDGQRAGGQVDVIVAVDGDLGAGILQPADEGRVVINDAARHG
jgi:hypothetical protein